MSSQVSARDRIRSAYQRGGISGVAATMFGYLKWRLAGSPQTFEIHDQGRAEAAAIVALMREWYYQNAPIGEPLISIVLPTRDRLDQLGRAIGSVKAQTYSNWELVVVNDGSAAVPTKLVGDSRVSVHMSSQRGVAGARNIGLDRSSGEIVTFLDDDNTMDPLWLSSIALTFEENPQSQVMVGAQLVIPDPGSSVSPRVRFPLSFDWERLIEANYVDMAMLAHRLPSPTRFDEELPAFVDWDYVVNLTVSETPVLAPALCGVYLTGAAHRISYQDRSKLRDSLRERFHTISAGRSRLEASLGSHDGPALVSLVGRLARHLQRSPTVLFLGVSQDLLEISEALASQTQADVKTSVDGKDAPDTGFDLVVTDTPLEDTVVRLVASDGLLIGLNASSTQYELITLTTSRRIGDSLWVGAREASVLENLFEGATLVKLTGAPDD
ncbi:MAG: glycosyltransferase family A protein [Acidimicrobiia bacterium]